MSEHCDGRITRSDGSWRPCDLLKGHGIDAQGFGCVTGFAGEEEPEWNPRDTERRRGERRADTLGKQLALQFRSYQAALNDPAYWEPHGRERNQQQVGEAFDRLVQLTNTILGNDK